MQHSALLTALVIVLILVVAGGALARSTKDSFHGWSRHAANQEIARRAGWRNDKAGYGAQRAMHPADKGLAQPAESIRQRNGSFMPPEKLRAAEEQAWDVGEQQPEGSWNETVQQIAVDPRTLEQHRNWVNEVQPFSQGAFSVDNSDEMVAMSLPRQGITAFRRHAPAQGPCTLFITENDAALHAQEFKNFNFQG